MAEVPFTVVDPPAIESTPREGEKAFIEVGGVGGPVQNFKMRAVADPGPGFEVWVVQNTPDFAGAQAPGAIVGGTAIVANQWET